MENINITLKIESIKDVKFFIHEIEPAITDQIKPDDIKIDIRLDYAVKFDEKIIILTNIIQYYIANADNREILLDMVLQINFSIPELAQIATHDMTNQVVNLPEQILSILTGIILATARGILFEKTKGYFVHTFHLPILNPTDLVKSIAISSVSQ